jgi:hypothetical protein
LFAARILAGRPIEIELLGSPKETAESLGRFRSLASYLGATVEDANDGPFSASLLFFPHPPARQ